ncbi:MAG: ribosome assembly RNA-binding protein YhbY [Desulforhopalus sp.]|nr:ribosome assembly RNA-binding protein YhbY [Desulforhopalus sp.]
MSEKKTPPVPTLTTRQKQFLKGLAHPLNPLVQIGKEELSPGVLEMIRTELIHHELIKVKIGSNCGLEKHSSARTIAEQTESELVQLIGKTIILYKPNPKRAKEKRIHLPKVK